MAKRTNRRRAVQPRTAPSTAVAAHVEELYKRGLEFAKPYREQALLNERYIHGDQWDVVIFANGKRAVRKEAWYDDEEIPRIAVNEVGPGHQTWSALMTKDRPTVQAAVANDSPENAYKAAIGNTIIDFLEGELSTADNVHKATSNAGMHGTGGIKVCFVEEEDKVTWSRLTIFDFVIDPRHADWRKAKWVVFEDYLEEDEALDKFEAMGVKRKPKMSPYETPNGDKLEGVRRLELWHKPCRKYPKGCYAEVVDGVETEYKDEYPYTFEDDSGALQHPLPLSLMRVREIRDCVYGGTNISAAVIMQHGYNEMVSRIQKELRDRKTHLFLPDTCEDGYLKGSTTVFFPKKDHQAANVAKYLAAGDVAQSLFSQRDFFQEKITTTIGLNQVTAGTESRTLSGRAIDNIVELDKDKNADATKEQQIMVKEAWDLSWRLVGRYYTDMRKARIANASLEDVLAFNATDVDGMDIRLEPASELDKLSTAKKLVAVEGQQSGAATPLDLRQTRGDGAVGFAREQAEQLVTEFVAGQPIDVSPEDLDMAVFEQVIVKHQARALAKRDRETWVQLENLRRQVRQLGATAGDGLRVRGRGAGGGAQPAPPQTGPSAPQPPAAPAPA